MNYLVRQRLMKKLAATMIRNGEIKNQIEQGNIDVWARETELVWQGTPFTIVETDGFINRIDRK